MWFRAEIEGLVRAQFGPAYRVFRLPDHRVAVQVPAGKMIGPVQTHVSEAGYGTYREAFGRGDVLVVW